jgi:type II secretory pathway predicted ATPase ExeA
MEASRIRGHETYEEYFDFSAAPFGRGIPVTELMKSGQWNELAGRLNHVARNREFGLFTGDTGTGKTTALRRMTAELDKNRYKILYVYDSDLTPRNFYVETLRQLGYKPRFYRGDAKRQLTNVLSGLSESGQIPVIAVDEAHLLSHEMLEEIRFLMNWEMDSNSACSLILMGQSELRSKLKLQIHQAIDGRIDMRFHLMPMSGEETYRYIKRRLEMAKSRREIYTEAALELIHDYSGGIPRKVNKAAHASLMAAASQKKALVDDYLVKEVIASEFEA